jgi:uncharacterized glyoxalase superfamily protein PhnB
MSDLVPYLTFRDGEASLRFLGDVLGFELIREQRDAQGGVVHAELRRGEAVIMGGEGDVVAGAAPGLYLVLAGADDVDAMFERAVAAGGAVGHAPEDTEWGTRRARVRDLDGHEWSFGTYVPGQAW